MNKRPLPLAALVLFFAPAFAANDPQVDPAEVQEAQSQEGPSGEEAVADGEAEAGPVSEDDMADLLNSRQQLKQSVRLKRTINGEVVEESTSTIIYDESQPVRPSEAGVSTLEDLRAEFDQATLTRNEAFEEAKIDFVLADLNRDEAMSPDEFAALVDKWRAMDSRLPARPANVENPDGDGGRFVDMSDAPWSENDDAVRAQALAKFAFMAGQKPSLSQKDYILEYLTDFDAMDMNNDSVLNGDELMRFRAANRGLDIDVSTIAAPADASN